MEPVTDSKGASRRSLVIFLGARFASMLGDGIWWVGIAWVATQVGEPGFVGTVLAIGGIPRLLLLLLGGTISDRYGARRVMLAADVAAVLVSLVVAGVSASVGPEPILLLVAALLFGSLEAFYFPSSSALLPRVRGPVPMPRAAAALQTVGGTAAVVGRSIGGVAVATATLTGVALANAASFAVSLALLLRIPLRDVERTPVRSDQPGLWGEARDGVRVVVKDPVLRAVSLIALALNAAIMPLTQVGIALRADEEGWGAGGLAAIAAGIGAGMVVGSLLALVLRAPAFPGKALGWWLAGAIASLIGAVLVDRLAIAVVLYACSYACMGPLNALLTSIVLTRAPEGLRGRVSAVLAIIGGAGLPVANALFGFAVGWLDLLTVQVGCLVLTCVALAIAVTNRSFRTVGS